MKDKRTVKTTELKIRLTEEEKELLMFIKDKTGNSMSKIVRTAIKFYYNTVKTWL